MRGTGIRSPVTNSDTRKLRIAHKRCRPRLACVPSIHATAPPFESSRKQKYLFTCPSFKRKTPQVWSFSFLVGALGFEPRVTRSQSEHVSRYTMPRNILPRD